MCVCVCVCLCVLEVSVHGSVCNWFKVARSQAHCLCILDLRYAQERGCVSELDQLSVFCASVHRPRL